MRKLLVRCTILLIMAWLASPSITAAQSTEEAVVQAVLFYSPTCPHCHYVITEVLVPMVDEYGDQLQIVGIDTSQPNGAQLFEAAIERYQIPDQRQGVPTLIIRDIVLVGSAEIPEQFPSLVEEGLASGGVSWPEIPGLDQVLSPEVEPSPSPTPTPEVTATSTPTVVFEATAAATLTPVPTVVPTPTPVPAALVSGDSELPPAQIEAPPSDPVGFSLAGLVLVGMVAALNYTAVRITVVWRHLLRLSRNPAAVAKTWAIPILSLAGLGVAAYLAYVEITHVEAVCGPVGECNLVQSSPYAQVLGIPVAVLGMLNYLAIGVLWAGQRSPLGSLANLSTLGLLGLTLCGTLFSIYLTLLELFVIHAICAWCLSSAAITTILMLLVALPITGSLSPKQAPPNYRKSPQQKLG